MVKGHGVVPNAAGSYRWRDVASILVALLVDSSATVFATPFDARGVPFDARGVRLGGIVITWSSTNLSVARVVPNPGSLSATVTAVGPPGVAQIEARIGNIVQTIIVQVKPRFQ